MMRAGASLTENRFFNNCGGKLFAKKWDTGSSLSLIPGEVLLWNLDWKKQSTNAP